MPFYCIAQLQCSVISVIISKLKMKPVLNEPLSTYKLSYLVAQFLFLFFLSYTCIINMSTGGFLARIFCHKSQFYQCLIYFDFFVVCSSASSMSHGILTQISRYFKSHYLNIKDLILDCMLRMRSKGVDIIKRFTFFCLCCLNLYYLISCKIDILTTVG